jgi:CelD/BcsL family acetyltransferase involved in cellulose biosynthesis
MNPHTASAVSSESTAEETARGALTVEVRENLDLPCDDLKSLNSMIDSRPDVGVFMSPAWLSGFLADPPPKTESLIVLLRDRRVLVGVAPLTVRRAFGHSRVGLLGGGSGSDRVDLLSARGYEAGCSDRFVAWLAETFGSTTCVFELKDVPLESPLWGALHRANDGGSVTLTVQPREVHTLPYLDLAEYWSTTVDAKSQLWRTTSLNRHRRLLDRRGRVRFERVDDIDEIQNTLTTLATLMHARFRSSASPSALDDPRTMRFHRHVLPLLHKDGRLRMLKLSVDSRDVAVLYILASGSWRGLYFSAYDRPWAGRIHLGRLAFAAGIDRAARLGATEFDFLKGAERVKYLWPVRTRGTLNADVYPENTGAQLVRAGAAARDAAVALAKSARRLFTRTG